MARIADPKELAPPVVERQPDMRPLIEGMIRAIQNITIQPAHVQVSTPNQPPAMVDVQIPEPVKQWVFKVKRDKEGFIETITASAQ